MDVHTHTPELSCSSWLSAEFHFASPSVYVYERVGEVHASLART